MGYFNDTTQAQLVADWQAQDATKQAVDSLPQIAKNFDASVERMRRAAALLSAANPAGVSEDTLKKHGAGLLATMQAVVAFVDARRPGGCEDENIEGTLPASGIGSNMHQRG